MCEAKSRSFLCVCVIKTELTALGLIIISVDYWYYGI